MITFGGRGEIMNWTNISDISSILTIFGFIITLVHLCF